MQVWNLLHAVCWKHRTQKSPQKSPSGHHHTILSGYIFSTQAHIDHQKNLLKQQYVLHMSPQYGELRPTSGWERSGSSRHPCKFQRVSRLGSVTARHLVVGVSQTLQRWTEGSMYVRQGDHHVGHWPTFLVTHILRGWKFPFPLGYLIIVYFVLKWLNSAHSYWLILFDVTFLEHLCQKAFLGGPKQYLYPSFWGNHVPFSSRQHLSSDNYLEEKGEDYRNFAVLYWVPRLHAMICTDTWAVLMMTVGLGLAFCMFCYIT